jgi:micrococcal nuclease
VVKNSLYTYNAKLIRVVDGDTVIADVDLGFDTWKRVNIRLYGIDTPETRTRDLSEKEKGIEAKEELISLLESNGNIFVLESKGVDKYGRSLGIIWTNYIDVSPWADSREVRPVNISINEYLLSEGFAKPYFGGKK